MEFEIGKIYTNKQNKEYKIIEILQKGKKYKVEFLENGFIREVAHSCIKKGYVRNTSIDTKKYIIDSIFTNTQNCRFKIIDSSKNGKEKLIKFLDDFGYEVWVSTNVIKSGAVKNPYAPSVYGVGYLGEGNYNISENLKITEEYTVWIGIIRRCYDKSHQVKNPTYIGVTISEEWKCFQTYAKWHDDNYPRHIGDTKFHLDKDLLNSNEQQKIYSPKTCVFLPQKINTFLANKRTTNTSGYTGVFASNSKFSSHIQDFYTNKSISLGTFNTPEEASNAYQIARAEQAEKAKQYLRELNYLPEEIIQLIK